MTRRVTEILLVVAITCVGASTAFGPPTPPPHTPPISQQQQQNLQQQQQKTEDLDNVKFMSFSKQGLIVVVQGSDAANRVGTWKIGPRQDENKKWVINQDMLDTVTAFKVGDLMKISATIRSDGHWVDSISKEDAQAAEDAKAIVFQKYVETPVAGGQTRVTVLIKTADKSDTLIVPNVKDNLGKWVADPTIMAVIKEFKEGDKIEYTRQTSPAGQVVIKTIKPAGAPDKAEFIKVTDKVVNGEKFTAIEVKEATDKDKPITLLVANTKDDKGKLVKDDSGNPVPDATMLEAVKAITPGQMVEFKSKAETPVRVMLTEIKVVVDATTQPADGDKAGAAADKGAAADAGAAAKPADNASK
jgi:hypothetical protein